MNHRSRLIESCNILLLGEFTQPTTAKKTKRSLSFQSQPKGETKRVQFCEASAVGVSIDIHLIPTLSEMTTEEKESCWLTRLDREKIEQQVRLDVIRSTLQHHQSSSVPTGQHDSRGLEWMTFDGVCQRNFNRQKGINAVLEEQQRQRSTCQDDDHEINQSLIAHAYQKAVENCQGKAWKTAIHDNMIASQIYDSENF